MHRSPEGGGIIMATWTVTLLLFAALVALERAQFETQTKAEALAQCFITRDFPEDFNTQRSEAILTLVSIKSQYRLVFFVSLATFIVVIITQVATLGNLIARLALIGFIIVSALQWAVLRGKIKEAGKI